MTRFFMPLSSTVELVFKATRMMRDREIFILKMPALYIKDLAQAMINVYAPRFGYKPEQIRIDIIGKKSGERVHEKLLSGEEAEYALEADDMFVVTPVVGADGDNIPTHYPDMKKAMQSEYSTKEQDKISVEEIEKMLQNEQPILDLGEYR